MRWLEYTRLAARAARPTSCIAVFHGLGGSRHELRPLAERWLSVLPSTAFLLFESPDRDYNERVLLSGEWSGDWHPFPKPRSAFGADADGYEDMVVNYIDERCNLVSANLDAHLEDLGLSNDQLILAGFSQGAAISAYVGLRRRCLAFVSLGGPCPPRASLLPDNDVTQGCLIVGDADHCAPHDEIRRSFEDKYAARARMHVIEGMGHVVGEASIELGLEFVRRHLCETGRRSLAKSDLRWRPNSS